MEQKKGGEMNKFLILGICSILVFSGANIFLVTSHEQAHVQIFNEYGVESEVKYDLLGAKTVALSGWEDLTKEDRRFMAGLQTLNEIFGYQIIALFNCLAIFTVFIIMMKKVIE